MTTAKKKETRGRKPLPKEVRAANIKRNRERDAMLQGAARAAASDIGPCPPCKDPERRAYALSSNKAFAEIYHSSIFAMEWSKDHLTILPKSDRIVDAGGKQAIAMPRGSGKTALCLSILNRASFSVKHPYCMYVGAVSSKGLDAIIWLKKMLLTNELLFEDFPEVCYPIRMMNDEPRRCLGQTSEGRRTKIRWSPDEITLPTIQGSALSGFTIGAGSMDGNLRGGFILLPDGRMVRPSFAVVDDFQTDESAKSQGPGSQSEKRLMTITRTVQGLAGPNSRISIFVPCTVIEQGDAADQLLNRKKFPDFHGERTKRLYSWPTNMKLWDEYKDIREDCQRADISPAKATEFYRARMCNQGRRLDDPTPCPDCEHKANCMDCGAVVDWVARLDNKPDMPEEDRNISSLQAAMHSFYEYGPAGFASEFQNDPLLSEIQQRMPSAEEICAKANGYPRGTVPLSAIHTVAFIDPGDYYHTWGACGFSKNLTASTIDYGTWPDQGRQFSKANPKETLDSMYPGAGKKGALIAGLVALMKKLLEKQFTQDGSGNPQKIELCLIDTGYLPDEVHAAIRLVGSPIFRASHGKGITATGKQFVNYQKERCREIGHHWWVPKDSPQNTIWIDTNYWKTYIIVAIKTMIGDPGALTFFGKTSDVELTAAHILAEYYEIPKSESGIDVQVWFNYPHKDNELLDILVGCMVAASKLGCSALPVVQREKKAVRRFLPVASSSSNPEWS